MNSGFGSWFGLGGKESKNGTSLFGRLRNWGSPSTSVQSSTGSKSPSSKKILKSIEIDDEPPSPRTPKKLNDEVSRIKQIPKNSDSPKQGSKSQKNPKMDDFQTQRIIDHVKSMETKFTSIDFDFLNEILTKIKADPDFKFDNFPDDESENEDSEDQVGFSRTSSKNKKSTMTKELRALDVRSEPLSKRRKLDPSTPKRKRTLSSGDSKKKGQRSPVKTRGVVTSTDADSLNFCLVCEGTDGPFIRCNVCEYRFHPICIQISLPIKYSNTSWRCFDCLRCSECMGYIDDPENVQCTRCGRAYHGYCKPVGSVGGYPFDHWHCAKCIKKFKNSRELEKFKKTKFSKKRIKSGHTVDQKDCVFFVPKNKVKDVRNRTRWTRFKKILTLTRSMNLEVPGRTLIVPQKMDSDYCMKLNRRRTGLRMLNKKINENHLKKALKKADFVTEAVEAVSEDLTEEFSNLDVEINGEIQPALLPYQTVWPTEDYMKDLENQKNTKKSKIKKNQFLNKKLFKYLSQFTFPDVLEDYVKIKEKALSLSKSDMEVYNSMIDALGYDDEISQFLHFGPSYIVPAKRSVPSQNPDFWNARLVFACHKCFGLFLSPFRFRLHLNMCEYSNPPGNEIYRDRIKAPDATEKIISFFEVVGEDEMDYCRRLCTVASALLPAKSVTNEVEMFKFYIITEFDENWGFIPAGFFSKENKPSQNNNLSCLLVFNQSRQSGYGKLLVDLSYLLSKKEKKFGSPEHPLSDDGLYLYRSYWTSVIFQYLRKHRNEKKISFEDISKETHIYIDDIVSTVLANGMIKQPSDGKTLVDCVKAWFTDIRILRRRALNPEKLTWEPELDPNEEQNDRYVCSSDDDDY